jgi:DNA-binding HxlR family transcriptional regulator
LSGAWHHEIHRRQVEAHHSQLSQRGQKKRSAELARYIPEASGKVLTAQLRELERDGIIRRKIFPTVPPKVEYSLTDLGKSLRPALKALADWGEAHSRGRKQG